MYTLKVLHITKSSKSALVEVTKEFGFLTSTVARGFIKLNKETTVGTTMELPATTKVSEKTHIDTNKDTGETVSFTWVTLD